MILEGRYQSTWLDQIRKCKKKTWLLIKVVGGKGMEKVCLGGMAGVRGRAMVAGEM